VQDIVDPSSKGLAAEKKIQQLSAASKICGLFHDTCNDSNGGDGFFPDLNA